MNVIGRLTVRHMMMNKKRTVVTIIGIIISVAMIMAVSTIAYSFTTYMGEGAMEKTGEFHVVFEKVPYENRDIVLEGNNIEESFEGKVIGDYNIKDIKNGNVRDETEEQPDKAHDETPVYLRLVGLEGSSFDKIYFGEIDGEYPSNENEIIVSTWYADGLNVSSPGETIEIAGKTYTVSGIYNIMDFETKNLEIPDQYTYAMFTCRSSQDIGSGDYINIYSKLYDLGTGIYDDLESIARESGCEGYYDNKDVLYYYGISEGNFGSVMNNIKYILIGVIMAGAIALIANGFSISLSERSKYLGMLASVGATKGQKRYSVFFEGFIVGIISIPLGILSGYIGTVITFKVIEDKIYSIMGENAAPITADVKPWVIIITVLFSVLTIFLSAYFPARRASKISPIDAIRQSKDIKVSGKQVKTKKITGKLFGFEGELALKNLKRNRKKYGITVFSLVVSIVLFLTVYSFVFYMTDSAEMVYEGSNFDMYGQIYNGTNEEREKIYREIKQDESVGEAAFLTELRQLSVFMTMDDTERYMSDSYSRYYMEFAASTSITDENPMFQIALFTYDEEYLRSFLEKNNISYDEFNKDKNNVIVINYTSSRIYENGTPKFYQMDFLKCQEGDTFTALINKVENDNYYDNELTTYQDEVPFKVIGLLDNVPLGMTNNYGTNTIPVIVTEEMFQQLVNSAYENSDETMDPETQNVSDNIFTSTMFYINGGDIDSQYKAVSEIVERNHSDMWGYSIYEQRKEQNDMLFIIQVFTYGFIVLITLVCAANIFNTISTSITLRKREFATLRSIGMTKKAFNKMIFYESGFYGIKALLYGLPLGVLLMMLIYYNLSSQFEGGFKVPWTGIIIAVTSVFIVISSSMMYAASKIKRENIIDGLKDENA